MCGYTSAPEDGRTCFDVGYRTVNFTYHSIGGIYVKIPLYFLFLVIVTSCSRARVMCVLVDC